MISLLLALVLQDPIELDIRRLESADIDERERASVALALAGDAAVPALRKAAADRAPETADRAKRVLARLDLLRGVTPRLEAAFPGVRAALAAGSLRNFAEVFLRAAELDLGRDVLQGLARPALRAAPDKAPILQAIARWKLDAAAPEFESLLDVDELRGPLVHAAVVCRARALGPALVQRLRAAEESRKNGWLEFLCQLRCPEALPELLARPEWEEGYRYLAPLDGYEAVPQLLRRLKQGHSTWQILDALLHLAPEEVVPALLALLNDPREHVVQRGLYAVRCCPAVETLPKVRELARSTSAEIRVKAVYALAALDVDLRFALKDDASSVRRGAALFIPHKDAIPELAGMLEGDSRDGALNVLGRIGGPEAAGVVGAATDAHAAYVLARGGVFQYEPFLTSANPGQRVWAYNALAVARGRDAAPALLKALETEVDDRILHRVRELVEPLRPPELVPTLLRLAKTHRNPAMLSLARLRAPEAVPLFLEDLRSDDGWRRRCAANQLADLGVKADLRGHPHALARLGEFDPDLLDDEGVFELNAIRRPEAWRAWRSRVLAGPARRGRARAILEGLIAVEWPETPPEDWMLTERDVDIEGRDLLAVVEETLLGAPGAVFEVDRLRVLSAREARGFWKRWALDRK